MATTRRVKVEDDSVDNTGPIIVKSSGEKLERVVLFTIDDREFTVPAKPRMNVALKFLNEMKKSGNEMFGMLQLLEDMLGPDDYQALLNYDELDDDLIGKVAEQCVRLALGTTEDAGK